MGSSTSVVREDTSVQQTTRLILAHYVPTVTSRDIDVPSVPLLCAMLVVLSGTITPSGVPNPWFASTAVNVDIMGTLVRSVPEDFIARHASLPDTWITDALRFGDLI
jgi:hypothetical protein